MCKIQDMFINDAEIMRILQVAGGNFPIGSFSQSYGLEAYIAEKRIQDTAQLKGFIKSHIRNVLSRGEAPILIEAYRCAEENHWEEIERLNQLSLASKLTRESREAFLKSGKALLRVGRELTEDEEMEVFYSKNKDTGISFNVAYAILMRNMGIRERPAVSAYFFSSANTVIQAAIKLMPLGNIEGQKVLTDMLPLLSYCVEEAFRIDVKSISNFAPMLDLASIKHENLTTRLYMS